jgi:DMSO/TMAO reductase YedYZ molybdopterin-dependent catalytic subunit
MLSRRTVIKYLPFAVLPGALARAQSPGSPPRDGLIVRMHEPQNLETPAGGLVPWQTPTEQFYVRSHFAVPAVNAETFKLSVTGHVESPLTLTLNDLTALAKSTKALTLECAGNGRVFLTPAVPGLQWGHGGVGNATWAGIPLGAVLERAKVKPGAVDVILGGADKGAITALPSSPGVIPYDRSIPLAKAQRDECLLATHMNGEPLTASHGAPLRAVVGGWYGMASVKWLTSIVVTDRPYNGFWQSLDYSVWDRSAGTPSLVPLTAMQPKAMMTSPGLNAIVPAGRSVTVTGKAWAGERTVAKVEVSTDGGKTWAVAKLADDEKPMCWRDWRYEWAVPANAGKASLLARCTDDKGTTQPDKRDPDRRSYMINHVVPVDVTIR